MRGNFFIAHNHTKYAEKNQICGVRLHVEKQEDKTAEVDLVSKPCLLYCGADTSGFMINAMPNFFAIFIHLFVSSLWFVNSDKCSCCHHQLVNPLFHVLQKMC